MHISMLRFPFSVHFCTGFSFKRRKCWERRLLQTCYPFNEQSRKSEGQKICIQVLVLPPPDTPEKVYYPLSLSLFTGPLHGQSSLVGYSPQGCTGSDTTECTCVHAHTHTDTHTHTHTHTHVYCNLRDRVLPEVHLLAWAGAWCQNSGFRGQTRGEDCCWL